MDEAHAAVTRVPPDALSGWTSRLLERVGLPAAEAAVVADHLVQANLRGIDSHGLDRLPVYVKRFETGVVARETRLTVVKETPLSALVDGGNGSGMVVARRSMEIAVRKAKDAGVAFVGVRGSNHCGFLAYYTAMALDEGLIGFATTSAPSGMAPSGGKKPYFGTNPISVAVPALVERPIILDMATSQVARGKVLLALTEGKTSIPEGWAIDPSGRPTTDPAAALAGAALPLGGYKGYGLALLVDVFSGILTGAAFGPHIGRLFQDFTQKQDVGHLFLAMRPDLFVPADEFRARVDQMIREVRSQPLAEGSERIYLPGEIEAETAERRRREGIPLGPGVRRALIELGARYDAPLPA